MENVSYIQFGIFFKSADWMYMIKKDDQPNHNPQYKKMSLFLLKSSDQIPKNEDN